MEKRVFVATPEQHRQLVLWYLRFPEVVEVFENIRNDRPLHEAVLSEWDSETLQAQIEEIVIPVLVKAGVIQEDQSRDCGHRTDYTHLVFEGLSRSQLARVSAHRAMVLAATTQDSDTNDDELSAYLNFRELSPERIRSLMERLRSFLRECLTAPDGEPGGIPMRLVMIARCEQPTNT